jgi:thiamine-phosphate pyrophosphorylase
MFDPGILTLVAITDDVYDGVDGLVARAAAAVRGGATMVQLRLKDADARTQVEVARRLIASLPVPVIVNDRVDVALASGAAGAHVGTEDIPVLSVRSMAPAGFIIGASVGGDADVGSSAGADYAGIGPVFETSSKSDAGTAIGIGAVGRLTSACGIPSVGIGGIDESNAAAVMSAGASGVAVIRALLGAPDPEAAARRIRRAIGR